MAQGGPTGPALVARALVDAFVDEDIAAVEGGESDRTTGWAVYDPLGSTAIERVAHRRRDGMMTVRFANRPLYPDYLFIDVPRELFHQWKRVKSAGSFYHRRIKGNFNV